jgi:hypothetical protein
MLCRSLCVEANPQISKTWSTNVNFLGKYKVRHLIELKGISSLCNEQWLTLKTFTVQRSTKNNPTKPIAFETSYLNNDNNNK